MRATLAAALTLVSGSVGKMVSTPPARLRLTAAAHYARTAPPMQAPAAGGERAPRPPTGPGRIAGRSRVAGRFVFLRLDTCGVQGDATVAIRPWKVRRLTGDRRGVRSRWEIDHAHGESAASRRLHQDGSDRAAGG